MAIRCGLKKRDQKMSKDRAVVVLAKNPIQGQVKTRLAKSVGDERALEIYKELYRHTLETMRKVPDCQLYVYQSPAIDRQWVPFSEMEIRLQSDGDLGDRMHFALAETLSTHRRVALVGADCPGMDETVVDKALSALSQVELVLGPSADGGFYLLASKAPQPDLLRNRKWSHGKVFQETIDIASKDGRSIFLLPELYDVDHLSDWERWQASS